MTESHKEETKQNTRWTGRNVALLSILEYFTNNVKSVKITEMVQQVMNKSTKISLPTDSIF
jgi:hypothetical protein